MTQQIWKSPSAIALLTPLLSLGVATSAGTAQVMHPAQPIANSEAAMPIVAYLDQLQTCAVGSQSPPLPLPLPFLEGVLTVAEIVGQEAETCVVETTVFLAATPDNQTLMSACQFTPETIALLTDDIAYEQARTGNYSLSTDDNRDMAISAAMQTECDLNFNWFEELNL